MWLALSDLAGTATILLDHRCGSISSSGGGISSSGSSAGARCVAHWRPYSSCAGPAGVWWGSSSSGGGGGTLGNAAGLGSRYCFTTGGKQLVTAWLLPPLSAAATAEQTRLAEAQLPFAGYANAVAAAALPWLQPGKAAAAAAALVAVGDSSGSVTVLLLVLPGGLQQQEPCAPEADRTAAPNGTATAPAQQPASLAGGGGSSRLVPLAAARRVHAGTPVRAVQLRLPALARGASLEQQLAAVEVVTAGGDGAVHTLRLPAAAVAAAQRTLGTADTLAADAESGAEPAAEAALAALQLGNGSQETAASHGSASEAAQAARPAAEQCVLPRLLAAASRRYEAVTHIEGILPAALDSSSNTAGIVVYGFHASHFAVWDEGADAEVVQVRALDNALGPQICLM